MLKALAAKHHSTVTKMGACYRAKIVTSDGLRRCLEARLTREGKQDLVARFGGIALRQDRRGGITHPRPVPVPPPPQGLLPRPPRPCCALCDQSPPPAPPHPPPPHPPGIPRPPHPPP